MTQLDRVFTETIEHWNIIAARLSKNMAEMEDHALYAMWMSGDLRDLLSTYDRLTALSEAGAVRPNPTVRAEMPVQTPTGTQQVASLRPTIDQLRQIGGNWADLMYKLEKFAAAYDLLLTRYAKFHTGDRVQLGITPAISDILSPGWLGSKHFLVAGAYGTVRDVDVRNGMFYCQVVFDVESWRDSKGIEHAVDPNERHSYCFGEGYLVAAAV